MRCLNVVCTFWALSAMLTWCTVSPAAILTFEANLDGLQETPPNNSPASGFGQATLDDSTGDFTIVVGNYLDLLGGATAVNVHQAAPGVAGGSILALTLDTPGAATGTFSGAGTLTAPQIAAMIAGDTYINIRSSIFPAGGEIRGQLGQVPEPSTLVLAVAGLLGLITLGWRRRKR